MTFAASAAYKGRMKRALAAVLLGAAVATVAGCGGTAELVNSPPHMARAADHGPKLAGEVTIVARSRRDVHICPAVFIATGAYSSSPTAPNCEDGLPAVGVHIRALSQAPGSSVRSGPLYLVGRYVNGTFYVTSQRHWAPNVRGHDPSATPPCPTPAGGWHAVGVDARPYRGMVALRNYGKTTGHRDITSVAFFDKGDVLTLASLDPARTRRVLGPYFPRQLCVVKARYPRKTVGRERGRMVRLIRDPNSPGAAAWGWPQGGGGEGVTSGGQPTTGLDVLIVTPKLQAYLDQQPPGIVVVDAALHPFASS